MYAFLSFILYSNEFFFSLVLLSKMISYFIPFLLLLLPIKCSCSLFFISDFLVSHSSYQMPLSSLPQIKCLCFPSSHQMPLSSLLHIKCPCPLFISNALVLSSSNQMSLFPFVTSNALVLSSSYQMSLSSLHIKCPCPLFLKSNVFVLPSSYQMSLSSLLSYQMSLVFHSSYQMSLSPLPQIKCLCFPSSHQMSLSSLLHIKCLLSSLHIKCPCPLFLKSNVLVLSSSPSNIFLLSSPGLWIKISIHFNTNKLRFLKINFVSISSGIIIQTRWPNNYCSFNF